MIGAIFFLLLPLGVQVGANPLIFPRSEPSANSSNPFVAITPSRSIHWVPCLKEAAKESGLSFECARFLVCHKVLQPKNGGYLYTVWLMLLQVPFDYSRPKAADEFSVAMIRVPATDKTHYKGPMFMNFGGPGGSGTSEIVNKSEKLRPLLHLGYDVVSWDPRGVGSTLPAVSCFATQSLRNRFLERNINLAIYSANDSLVQRDAQNQVLRHSCAELSNRTIPYIGTVSVARDLLRMVEAYGHSKQLTYM